MINVFWALAGPALTVPVPALAAESAKPSGSTPSHLGSAAVEGETSRSAATARVADWIAASGDNGSLPYIIVDKKAASLFLFDAKRKPLGKAPVLVGVAVGDDATPGVGSKTLADLGPAEKTTPSGRFL